MLSRCFWTTPGAARRALLVLVLAAMLLPGAVGPAGPVGADDDDPIVRDNRDPDARIQIIIKSVHIFDNHDVLDGEIRLHAVLAECVGTDCSGVDQARQIPEMDERNNILDLEIPARQAAAGGPARPASPGPSAPEPSAAQADLVVSAIRINGKDPGANDACKSGKNDVR